MFPVYPHPCSSAKGLGWSVFWCSSRAYRQGHPRDLLRSLWTGGSGVPSAELIRVYSFALKLGERAERLRDPVQGRDCKFLRVKNLQAESFFCRLVTDKGLIERTEEDAGRDEEARAVGLMRPGSERNRKEAFSYGV